MKEDDCVRNETLHHVQLEANDTCKYLKEGYVHRLCIDSTERSYAFSGHCERAVKYAVKTPLSGNEIYMYS